jgi:hypothetical protein
MRSLPILSSLAPMLAYAADRDLAGSYSGEWKSGNSDSGGTFRLALETASAGAWKCDVTFTYSGQEIKTAMRQAKVDQGKLDATYDFELQGVTLRSHITGAWNGKAFDGRYETTVADGGNPVDNGTWNAARLR